MPNTFGPHADPSSMAPLIYFLFVALASLYAMRNWRFGFILLIFAGVLQDPVRKLMPDAPGFMVLAFTPIWLAICVRVFQPNFGPWRDCLRNFPPLHSRINFFLFTTFLAAGVLIFKHGLGAWVVGAIGGISYVFPLLAMIVGFYFARAPREFERLIAVYGVFTAVILIGGWLEYLGLFKDWNALGTEALGKTWIRYVTGYVVELNSGFYRSPDFLGWHAAMLVMFSSLMAVKSSSLNGKVIWFCLLVWGGAVLLISGRNKMIFMPLVFLGTVVAAYLYKSNLSRVMSMSLTAILAITVYIGVFSYVNIDKDYTRYLEEGTEQVSDRLNRSIVDGVVTSLSQSGFFGEGLGTASLGKRYGGDTGIETWQESGLSRLMVELGVLGFIAIVALLASFLATLFKVLKSIPRHSPNLPVFVGLVGILAANGASFIISHQIFGDPFIIVLTGFLLGMSLSIIKWPERSGI